MLTSYCVDRCDRNIVNVDGSGNWEIPEEEDTRSTTRKIRGRRGILEVDAVDAADAVDAVFSQTAKRRRC